LNWDTARRKSAYLKLCRKTRNAERWPRNEPAGGMQLYVLLEAANQPALQKASGHIP
jgi:hypothetical protein